MEEGREGWGLRVMKYTFAGWLKGREDSMVVAEAMAGGDRSGVEKDERGIVEE